MTGQVLDGRYELLERLGAGGMGVVWRARHVRLDREVAVKVIANHIATDGVSAARFEREARAAAALHHDHLAPVYDFGIDRNLGPYLVMPYLRGEDLGKRVTRGGPLPPAEALRVVGEAAAGLHAAHAAGLVHRDIKPENLFLTTTGKVLVLDFGLAREVDVTISNPGAGSPRYMAPEQHDPGEFGAVGVATDVYGLAGVLHWCATGHHPFPSATNPAQLYTAHTRHPRPQPGTSDPALAWLDPVVAQGMAVNQADRHPTAEALAGHAHKAWQQHTAAAPTAQAPAARPLRWQHTHTLEGVDTGEKPVVYSPDGRRLATPGTPARLWDTATGRQTLTLTGHTGQAYTVAFSPDGRGLFTADTHGTARLWDTTTGHSALVLKGHTGAVQSVAFSPDGRQLATSSGEGTVQLWDTATGRQTLTLTGHKSLVLSAAFSPDGRLLATASLDGTARLWDTATGRQTATLTGHTGAVLSVAFSPDGRLLATAGVDGADNRGGTARLWDTATGRQTLTLTGHTTWVWSAAFAPDGRLLATASLDGTARLWDTATGQATATLTGHTNGVWSAVFSPDGRQLATSSKDGTARLWRAVPAAS